MIGNLYMLNGVDLKFYIINEDLRRSKLLCWWDDTNCYDVLQRHLMVSRGYALMTFELLEWLRISLSVCMRYMMVLNIGENLVSKNFVKLALSVTQ